MDKHQSLSSLNQLLTAIILLGAIFIGIFYLIQWSSFKETRAQMDQVSKIVESKYHGSRVAGGTEGVGSLSTVNNCWSNSCPYVSEKWSLAIDKGGEIEVMKNLIQDTGYIVTTQYPCSLADSTECSIQAESGKFHASLIVTSNPETDPNKLTDLVILIDRR